MNRYLLPVMVFVLIVAVLAWGLAHDPRKLSSPLIGKPLPAFDAPRLLRPEQQITHKDLLGRAGLVNVWASWCAACRQEHPVLVAFSRQHRFPVYGLNYKDRREDARRWLDALGNPYRAVITDPRGMIGIDWGVYGVPETFVIDKRGIIRHKHIGPLTDKVMRDTILPLLDKLEAE